VINHVRTLLLNTPAVELDQAPLSEYIDPQFVPRLPPLGARAVRNVIFGPRPDPTMRNLRVRQLLSLGHASDLADRFRETDTRITYLPFRDEPESQSAFNLLVTGTDPMPIVVMADETAIDDVGILDLSWFLQYNATPTPHIVVTSNMDIDTVSLPVDETRFVALPGGPTVLIPANVADSTRWAVHWTRRPCFGIAEVVSRVLALPSDQLGHCFEDQMDLLAIFLDSTRVFGDRVAALCLGLAGASERAGSGLRNS
jgi:hypothetical protein